MSKESRSETRVVKIGDDVYDVYIGRPSKWGNPFILGADGDRDDVIAKYREFITSDQEQAVALRRDLSELQGKRLGCYCSPKPCHGDVLVELLKERRTPPPPPAAALDPGESIKEGSL